MEYPVFRIKTDGIHAKLYADDTEIKGVYQYSITHEAGKLPEIHLDITAQRLDFDSDMYPPLPEPWASYYASHPYPAPFNDGGSLSEKQNSEIKRVKPGSFVGGY